LASIVYSDHTSSLMTLITYTNLKGSTANQLRIDIDQYLDNELHIGVI